MRIAIISLPFRSNIGQYLQAYATQCILQAMGHQTTQIDHVRYLKINPCRFLFSLVKRAAYKLLGRTHDAILYERWYNQRLEKLTTQRLNATKVFFEQRRIINSFSQIHPTDYDGFIVGSDQVWRPKLFTWEFETDFTNAFLKFTQGWAAKRVAYAASLGFDTWTIDEKTTEECRRLVKLFDGVSVREHSAIALCEQNLGVTPLHVLDPTMLLYQEDYERLVEDLPPLSKNIMMTYILDKTPTTDKLTSKVTEHFHLSTHQVISRVDDETAPIEERLMPPIKEWLQGYRDAQFVVTDSFHGTVFAIIFNKPFVTIGNKERGMTRFHSLLETFGLEDRLIEEDTNFDIAKLKPINWNEVNAQMEEKRRFSLNFLRGALMQPSYHI